MAGIDYVPTSGFDVVQALIAPGGAFCVFPRRSRLGPRERLSSFLGFGEKLILRSR